MGGKMSRTKGHAYEREVAKFFRWVLRGFTAAAFIYRGHQSRSGTDAPDVKIPGNWWVECKRGKRTNIRAGLRQAEAAAPDGWQCLVFTRDDRDTTIVSMREGAFEKLYRGYWAHACNMGCDELDMDPAYKSSEVRS